MVSVQLCAALAGLAEGVDVRLFPSAYKALERELGFSPKSLGKLNMIGGLAFCGTMVLWGMLADSCNRKRLFVVSTVTLGAVTLTTSMASSFWAFAVCRVAAGIFSAALFPVTQSLVSEVVPREGRGAAFGLLAFAGSLSAAAAAQLSARLLWRNAYMVMGSATLALGCVIQAFMPDLDRDSPRPGADLDCSARLAEQARKVTAVFSRRTFLALLYGGIVGCVPWSALSFSMMFFEGMGFTTAQASDFITWEGIGKALGNIAGGRLGDFAAARFPLHGRALLAQVNIASGMVACFIQLVWIPRSTEYFYAFVVSHFLFGLAFGPLNPGVDRPLWAELVSPSCRGTIVAWWTCIAGSFGAVFGAPIVGWLAEAVLGYRPSKNGAAEGAGNTEALASALVLCTMLPWALCLCCYSAIHCTYAHDVATPVAEAESAARAPAKVLGAVAERDAAEACEEEVEPLGRHQGEEADCHAPGQLG